MPLPINLIEVASEISPGEIIRCLIRRNRNIMVFIGRLVCWYVFWPWDTFKNICRFRFCSGESCRSGVERPLASLWSCEVIISNSNLFVFCFRLEKHIADSILTQ